MLSFPAPSWGIPVADEQPQPPGPTKADSASPRYGRTATLIVPRLYLSDYYTAQDEAELSKLCITHVLSVTDMNPVLPELISANNRLHVRLADRSDVDILSHLEKTTAFIRDALNENEVNRVLVCDAYPMFCNATQSLHVRFIVSRASAVVRRLSVRF